MSHNHYTHLSHDERVILADWWHSGRTVREIARHLRRSSATISRELERNGRPPTAKTTRVNKPRDDARHARGRETAELIKCRKRRYEERYRAFKEQSRRHYTAAAAETLARTRVKLQIPKLEQPVNEELLQFVITALDSRWSPEQISGRVKYEGLLPAISHQAIYNFIYNHPELGLKAFLRRKGKKYRRQKPISYNTTNDRRRIDERPAIVDEVVRIGDLEGDTIVGKKQTDRLLTHNDRVSGVVAISRMIGFTAERVSWQTVKDISRVFTNKIYSTTYDNGVEFTMWYRTERELATKIYFAHPITLGKEVEMRILMD